MAYRLVKGTFHLYYRNTRHVGSRPDGDSVWFLPDQPSLLSNLQGRDAAFNRGGFCQLRFEGIDALELHYKGSNHQKVEETVGARDELLNEIGFGQITYAPSSHDIDSSVRSAANHPVSGYILTRTIDPFKRPVAFVFKGSTRSQDGSDVYLRPAKVSQSLNAHLMELGLVYPGYYAGLPYDLRNQLNAISTVAESAGLGVWAVDQGRGSSGVRIRSIDDLSQLAIWPKLYRRLLAFFRAGNNSISGFDAWLRGGSSRDDRLWIVSIAMLENLHDVVRVSGDRIRLLFHPSDLIIVPR